MRFTTKHNGRKKIQIRGGSKRRAKPRVTLERGIVALAERGGLAHAGKRAIERLQKKGISATFKRGRQIIAQHPDGRVEVLGEIPPVQFTPPRGVRIIKGQ